MSKPAHRSFQQIWRHMDHGRRRLAAEAFCAGKESTAELRKATGVIATKLNLRPQTAAKLPTERIATYLASIESLDELLAATLVRRYLFTHHQPMLTTFLDELHIPHKNGAIADETVAPPSAEALRAAVDRIRASFDPVEVQLYLAALAASDSTTWVNLEPGSAAATPASS